MMEDERGGGGCPVDRVRTKAKESNGNISHGLVLEERVRLSEGGGRIAPVSTALFVLHI